MSRAVLNKDELNNIYRDMMARLEMGLLHDDSNELDGTSFGDNLREAILEKMPSEASDKHRTVDPFSVAFGVISERILREHYRQFEREWW